MNIMSQNYNMKQAKFLKNIAQKTKNFPNYTLNKSYYDLTEIN